MRPPGGVDAGCSAAGPAASGRLAQVLAKTTAALHRWGGAIVATGRFVPMGRTAVAVATGYARFPRRRFLPALLVGAVLWSCYMVALGYVGGRVLRLAVRGRRGGHCGVRRNDGGVCGMAIRAPQRVQDGTKRKDQR